MEAIAFLSPVWTGSKLKPVPDTNKVRVAQSKRGPLRAARLQILDESMDEFRIFFGFVLDKSMGNLLAFLWILFGQIDGQISDFVFGYFVLDTCWANFGD